jgi:hypothetical protein
VPIRARDTFAVLLVQSILNSAIYFQGVVCCFGYRPFVASLSNLLELKN